MLPEAGLPEMRLPKTRLIVAGGIGSGKSTVTKILMDAGAAVIHADEIGHLVLEPEGEAHEPVSRRWPQVLTDGVIDRSKLASIVFSDAAELAFLESITHPAIGRKIRELTSLVQARLFVLEVPVMTDFVGADWKRIVVTADPDIRRNRLQSRGMGDADIDGRITSQPSDEEWADVADHVIVNEGTIDELRTEVETVLGRLLAEQS